MDQMEYTRKKTNYETGFNTDVNISEKLLISNNVLAAFEYHYDESYSRVATLFNEWLSTITAESIAQTNIIFISVYKLI